MLLKKNLNSFCYLFITLFLLIQLGACYHQLYKKDNTPLLASVTNGKLYEKKQRKRKDITIMHVNRFHETILPTLSSVINNNGFHLPYSRWMHRIFISYPIDYDTLKNIYQLPLFYTIAPIPVEKNYIHNPTFSTLKLITANELLGKIVTLALLNNKSYQVIHPGMLGNYNPSAIVIISKDSMHRRDSIINKRMQIEKLKRDSALFASNGIEDIVSYSSNDSAVLNVPSKMFYLYGKSKADYKDIGINARVIAYNQITQNISAYGGGGDTTGNPLNKAKFTQGSSKSISDTLHYNMASKKGFTRNTFFNEGDIFINAQESKKEKDNVIYIWKGAFTTCNYDTPHYAFKARKIKFISNKIAVCGPATFEVEGVPLPIAIPFGIFPLNPKKHSGVIIPQFAASANFGLGLQGLGYYQVITEHWDATIVGDVYTYGGWNLNLIQKYIKRYRYSGGLTLNIQNTRILNDQSNNIPGQPLPTSEFTTSRSFLVQWQHSQDTKALPGVSFSANATFGSNQYNQYANPGVNNPNVNYQNQLSSSVQFSKAWNPNNPVTLSINLTHSQNSVTRLITVNFPSLTLSVNTLYPFQSKNQVGNIKWYEKLGFSYTGSFSNVVNFYDNRISLRGLIDTAQYSFTHNIPISIQLPKIGPITITPSANYSQNWTAQRVILTWNPQSLKVDTVQSRGLFITQSISPAVNLSTNLFGTFLFPNARKIVGIRHKFTPTFGLSYTPVLNANAFRTVQVDTFGNRQQYNIYPGANVGGPVAQGNLNFSFTNALQIKVRDKRDTVNGNRKVSILDNLGISGSYNLLADSNQLSPINIQLATNVLNNKVSINANATLNPYKFNQYGYQTKNYAWQGNNFSLGTITSASIALGTQFQSKKRLGVRAPDRDRFLTEEDRQFLDYVDRNPWLFADFNVPWQFSFSYSLNYTQSGINPANGRLLYLVTSNISAQGNISLTPKWKIGASTIFDFTTAQIQNLSLTIARDMHCWQLNITITPVGIYRSFTISFSPKSTILRDLKINRTRQFYSNTGF